MIRALLSRQLLTKTCRRTFAAGSQRSTPEMLEIPKSAYANGPSKVQMSLGTSLGTETLLPGHPQRGKKVFQGHAKTGPIKMMIDIREKIPKDRSLVNFDEFYKPRYKYRRNIKTLEEEKRMKDTSRLL